MGYTRIKICGVTRPDDARTIAAAGADAIGLVFHPPSARAVGTDDAVEVIAALPPFVTAVALFLDPEPEHVRQVVDRVPVGLLQFHGSESPEFCSAFGRPYIKAVAMGGNGAQPDAVAAQHRMALGLLVDSHEAGRVGGTGTTFAWGLLPRNRDYNLILAGGLSPDNVAAAVATVRPDAVDVSSGVESSPGIKDASRIERFVEEVRRGDRNEQGD